MSTNASPKFQEPASLIPINLHDQSEFECFQGQRVECGWNFSTEQLQEWRDRMDAGQKFLFWVTLDRDKSRAGHVALDTLHDSPEPELRNNDKSIMTINTFFILQAYQDLGLGRWTMDAIEDLATKEPYGSKDCKAIAVDTLNKKYYDDPVWNQQWRSLSSYEGDAYKQITFSAQKWYERRGYVEYKERPKYQESDRYGGQINLVAAFLRKDLR